MDSSFGAAAAIKGARILLVDNDAFSRKIAGRLLADLGATVATAGGGREAVERLGGERFDCVLMNVRMPGMDGPEATRLIRAEGALAMLPVLALAADDSDEDRVRCRAAGMNDFIAKPLVRAHLHTALAEWLPRRLPDLAAAADTVPAAVDAPPSVWHVPSCDPEVIDLTILSASVSGDAEQFHRCARLFVDTTMEALADLREARSNGDLGALSSLGQRLKSPCRRVGALGLVALCEALETMNASGTFEEAERVADRISAMAARTFAAISAALP